MVKLHQYKLVEIFVLIIEAKQHSTNIREIFFFQLSEKHLIEAP